MAKYNFPYTPVHLPPTDPYPQGVVMQRPLLVAKIIAQSGRSVPVLVLVDSGADACLFPLSIARMLQLDLKRMPQTLTEGVGSSANVTYYDEVRIELHPDIVFEAHAGFH